MPPLPIRLVCDGCGAEVASPALPPFACPKAMPGDGIDHLLARRVDFTRLSFPRDPDPNPFLAFRTLSYGYHLALQGGLSDAGYCELVRALDARVAAVDGHGFTRTPSAERPALATAAGWPGVLLVKDETGNVSGSHKARHVMGLAILLEVAHRLGDDGARLDRPLAISSCGNAALAAAVVARAAGRRLQVFVPTWADAAVLDRLAALDADVVACPRPAGFVGDPCTARFREAVAAGAIPFSCQGPDNGLVIEGGMTLAWELVAARPAQGSWPDRLFVQVGGGALASATIQALSEAASFGAIPRLPAICAVQTEGAAPLCRAYLAVLRRLLSALGHDGPLPAPGAPRPALAELARWAGFVAERHAGEKIAEALAWAATHRADFMWPWESEPHSLAHGILDDETYDWLALVRGMLLSGGFPVVVGEPLVEEAARLGRDTGIPVDPTGTSGLAGLLAFARAGLAVKGERAGVFFTGRERSSGPKRP